MNISGWLNLNGKYLYAARTLLSVLHVLRCCSTSHLSPLISSPTAFISTSLFFNPPLFFSSHSVFFLLQNPASPFQSRHSLITSFCPPLLFFTCTLPFSSSSLPPVCAVEYFPSLPLAFSLYLFPFRYCRYYLFSPVCLIILFPFL